jgi:acetyl-CoA acetyltransferase
MSNYSLCGKTAIVGVGATEFSKKSGRSEMQLALEAITSALTDAGIQPSEVDGLTTYSIDNNAECEVFRLIGGKELKYFARTHYGGGAACAPVMQGAMAVAAGICDVVVAYRAMNERSGFRFGQGQMPSQDPNAFETIHFNQYFTHGLVTAAAFTAMVARRYMHQFGATSEDFGRVTVALRDFAATNPNAMFHQRPITLDDHQNSRWVVEPLRLLDCCLESDGAVAVVITSLERAKDLRQRPALIKAAAQGATGDSQFMTGYYHEDITDLPETQLVAKQLFEMARLSPADIQTVILYDHFSPFVLLQLEALGFCRKGEAIDFVRDGHTARGGNLPVNPHGGQLGEAYIHGFNGVAEAVRQVRGTSVNPVDQVANVLVTAAPGLPTGGLILGVG